MKIVKSNAGIKQIFDTDDLLSVEQYYGSIGILMALHHTHDKTRPYHIVPVQKTNMLYDFL